MLNLLLITDIFNSNKKYIFQKWFNILNNYFNKIFILNSNNITDSKNNILQSDVILPINHNFIKKLKELYNITHIIIL